MKGLIDQTKPFLKKSLKGKEKMVLRGNDKRLR
jgi:hypothetical protein